MTIQRHIVVLSLSLFIVVGSLTGGVGAVPALTEEVSTNATGHATSVSLTANDQTTDGSRIDIASYDLSTEGETLAVWSLSNGSLDTVIGSVAPDSLSGTIEIELDQTLQENQTVAVAVHSSQPMTDNVIVSDRAELTIETVPASVTFNDQTSSGQSVDIAAYTLGSDGETVAVWSVTEDGSPDQVLASVTPSSSSGTTSLLLESAIDTNQTLVAAVHSGDPTADNVLAADTAAITIETVPASVTFNDQTSSGRSVDVADYDLGSDGETVAVWSVTEDGSPDQVLASVTPSSQSGTLSPFLASAIDTNQTLVAAVHSGDPTADNVLAADTAAITIETVPASVTFNDQIINDRFVDVASFSLGNNGQTLAIWSVTEDGSPGQVLGSVTLTAVSGTKSLGTSPYVRTNQTLAATIHSGEPTAANILAVDTADIAVDLNPSVGGNPPARTIDGDRLLEDITGDGSADLFDALSYYNNRNTDAIQNNPTQFDFDRDGDTGDLFDALALWNEISG